MSMKVELLKAVDRVVGRFVVNLLPMARHVEPCSPDSILIIRPGGIGDAVLLIPAVINLKEAFPNASIDILAEKRNGSIFTLCSMIRRVFFYDRPRDLIGVFREKYDVVIDSEQSHYLSAIIARLVKASLRIGFATNERRRLFSHAVAYNHDNYEVDSFRALLAPLGVLPARNGTPFLKLTDQAMAQAAGLLSGRSHRHLVAIFPGASIPEKRWGSNRYRVIAKRLLEAGCAVLVVGGPQDQEATTKVSGGLDVLNLGGRTTLAETAAVLKHADVVLSGDSGVFHVATGLNVPTVSLFGPSNRSKWAATGERCIVLSKEIDCSPCSIFGSTPKCLIDAKCMKDISVDEVFKAVMSLLKRTQAQKAN